MKFFKKYTEFFSLNESNIELDVFYKSQNIPLAIQKFAEQVINEGLRVEYLYKKTWQPKIILWFARAVKKLMLQLIFEKKVNSILNFSKNLGLDNDKYATDYFKGVPVEDIIKKYNLYIIPGERITPGHIESFMTNCLLITAKQEVFRRDLMNKLPGIFDFILSPARRPNEKPNWNGSFEEVSNYEIEWHNNLKASGKITDEDGTILKTYPDGYYWIDLETSESKDEALAMGHCGRTSADTLWSLRDSKKEPHLTAAIENESDGNVIYQLKGKQNAKPVEKYHPYIFDMLIDTDTFNIIGQNSEYRPELDFNIIDLQPEQIAEIFKKSPRFIESLDFIPFFKLPDTFIKTLDKEDIINYINRNKFQDKLDILSIVKFLELGIISDDITLKDIKIEDGKIYYFTSDVSDFSDFFDTERRENSKEKFKYFVVDGERVEYYENDSIEDIIRYADFNTETITDIINSIKKYNIDISDSATIKEIGKIFSEYPDELYEIIDAIRNGYTVAKEDADTAEAHNTFWKALEKLFEQNIKINADGYIVEIKKTWILECYKNSDENNEIYGSRDLLDYMKHLIEIPNSGYSLISINFPQYGWDGDIKSEDLMYSIKDKLDQI
jgi:hypothetical protein